MSVQIQGGLTSLFCLKSKKQMGNSMFSSPNCCSYEFMALTIGNENQL